MDDTQNTPYGYCHCGCGERAPLAHQTDTKRGYVRGEPRRFVCGHGLRRDPVARFWAQIVENDATGCWEWQGSLCSNGYGRLSVGWGVEKRDELAHRFAHDLLIGPIPDGLEIDHLCRNRRCVNPGHLEAVTHEENVARYVATITRCPRGHAYTEANTYIHPKTGGRDCRLCRNRIRRKEGTAK